MAKKNFLAELVHGNVYILRGKKPFLKNQPVAVDAETAKKLEEIYDYKTIKGGGSIALQKFAIDELGSENEALSIQREVELENQAAEDAAKQDEILQVVKATSTRLRANLPEAARNATVVEKARSTRGRKKAEAPVDETEDNETDETESGNE